MHPSTSTPLPIVYIYIVVPTVCHLGLPAYIKTSLSHSILTQPDSHVVLVTNAGECVKVTESVQSIAGLTVLDSVSLASQQTSIFHNLSKNIFVKDNSSELWMTSALRFFVLEDVMRARGYSDLLHVEADNMLYGPVTSVLPTLRQHYPLAATPLTFSKTMVTASVLWVSGKGQLAHLTSFLLDLVRNRNYNFDR
ncbi:hypothetical protein EON64_04045 [archaeon]|nr:MAG: hypothetical protein EON64_04045 [archaeon]